MEFNQNKYIRDNNNMELMLIKYIHYVHTLHNPTFIHTCVSIGIKEVKLNITYILY